MLKKLQKKWKVNGLQLVLILCTFAIGGSLCGFIGRKLLNLFSIDNKIVWLVLYIVLITILWPLCVLLLSIPFGQLPFFKKYLRRIAGRITGKKTDKTLINIAVFASGAGSNAEKMIASSYSQKFKVALIISNKPGAGVLKIAATNHVPVLIIEKERFFVGDAYLDELKKYNIDFIVLAGFLWKMPVAIIKAYPGKIINIHPALLPKYGGKGMYGNRVHEAVIAAREKESGITIHYVDEHYDTGDIILQVKCIVQEHDTPEILAKKIHVLEHEYYPKVIGEVIRKYN